MAELVVRESEPEIVANLGERAKEHSRSVEEEHKATLRDPLLGNHSAAPAVAFEQYLRMMPDTGTDAHFARIEGTIRDVDLAE